LAVGDLNQDGRQDIFVTNSGDNTVSIMYGRRYGGFADPVVVRTAHSPGQLAAVDIDRDGSVELVVDYPDEELLGIFRVDDSGRFVEDPSRIQAAKYSRGFAVGDIDGDRDVDLVLGNDPGDVLYMFGDGDGNFDAQLQLTSTLAVVDVNHDGIQDVILADERQNFVRVDFGKATEELRRESGIVSPTAVAAADFNGDKRTDLIVANGGRNEVLIFPGTADGFGHAERIAVGADPTALVVEDVTGDGLPDLIVANEGSNDVSILISEANADGNIALRERPRARLKQNNGTIGRAPSDVKVVDFDLDGVSDLLVAARLSDEVYQFRGVGGGFFEGPRAFALQKDDAPTKIIVPKGDIGFFVLNQGSDSVQYFNHFNSGESQRLLTGGNGPVAAIADDVNLDGLYDLIVANYTSGNVVVLTGLGDGNFLPPDLLLEGISRPTALAVTIGNPGTLWVYNTGSDAPIAFELDVPWVVDLSSLAASLIEPAADVLSEYFPIAEFVDPLTLASFALILPAITVSSNEIDGRQMASSFRDNGDSSSNALPPDADDPLAPSGEKAFAWMDELQSAVTTLLDELLLVMDAPWMTEDVYDFVLSADGAAAGSTAVASLLSPMLPLSTLALKFGLSSGPGMETNNRNVGPQLTSDQIQPRDQTATDDQPDVLAASYIDRSLPVRARLVDRCFMDGRLMKPVVLAGGLLGSAYFHRRRRHVRDFQ
jgi:hypothetical protein